MLRYFASFTFKCFTNFYNTDLNIYSRITYFLPNGCALESRTFLQYLFICVATVIMFYFMSLGVQIYTVKGKSNDMQNVYA